MAARVARGALCTVLFAVAAAGQVPDLVWRGNPTTLAAVGGGETVAKTLSTWGTFAVQHGYRLLLSDDRRVLLVLSGSYARPKPKKEHNGVEEMRKVLRDSVLVSERCVATAGEIAPVVIVCVQTAHYPDLLACIAGLDPRTKDWCDRAAPSVAGFILSEPLVAAWIEDANGVDEWHPCNELAHRTAQLLLRRHAPRLPDWMLLGFGWHVEDTVRQSIYCFPHRASFVSVAEHTDWGLSLANRFKKARRAKADAPLLLTADEFAGWKANAETNWSEGNGAMLAFGVVRYLAHERPEAILPFAKECSAAIEKGSIVKTSEYEWTTNPEFMLPAAQQLELLEAYAPDLLATVTTYFQAKKANERRLAKS